MRIAALLLLCAFVLFEPALFEPMLFAQDARSLVARAVAADDTSDSLARNYIFDLRNDIRELDRSGKVKSDESTVDEVMYIGGKRYFRPLEKNGKPLPAAQQRREQQKLDRAAAEASKLTEAGRNKRIADAERERAKDHAQFKDVPDAFDFRLLGMSVIGGRPAYRISATPRRDYHGALANILRNVQGTLWIDKQDSNWVKIEADVLKPFSLGWVLARVGAGTHLTYEMMRVNNELWAPKEMSLKASARLMLLKKVNVEQEVTFSGYRKFETDSRIVSASELKHGEVP